MRIKLIWHRYWLTKRGNSRRLWDRKTKRECEIGGTINEKWINWDWDPYHLWSSVTSSPPLCCKNKREKNRPSLEDKRDGDKDTLTDMSQTMMTTICHQLLTHVTALQRVMQTVHARTHPSTLKLESLLKLILPASLKLSRWDRSLLPFPLCCSYPSLYLHLNLRHSCVTSHAWSHQVVAKGRQHETNHNATMDIPPLSACSDFTSPLVICQKGLHASGLQSGRYSSINTGSTALPLEKIHAHIYEFSNALNISQGLFRGSKAMFVG